MAAGRDLNAIATELVMKVLDGMARQAGEAELTPPPLRHVAEAWSAIEADDREEIARYVGLAVQGALAIMPVAVASASKRVRRRVKAKKAPAAAAVEAPPEPKKRKKKDKKKNKKDKKDRKKKKKGKKKK